MRLRALPLLAVVFLGAAAADPHGGATREVAVTFDDLPLRIHVGGAGGGVADLARMTDRLVATITRHHIPAVGFVNEGMLAPGGRVEPERVALLRAWVRAGLELGNHAYSHPDLHRTPIDAYEADVARGDSVTRRLLAEAGRPAPRWFRHPFLHTGRNVATRERFERFLAARGYRVAPVTMDNNDYIFAAAYERALAERDSAGARELAEQYVAYMTAVFDYYERQSTALFGREIPQVLLVHASQLNADHFEEVARVLENRGYRFVPLSRAVADSAYRTRDGYTGPAGITWLHRWALTMGKRGAFFAGEPAVPEAVARRAAIPR